MTVVAEPIFNREAVLEMVDGEVDFVCELIDLFLADLQSQVETVRRAVASGQADTVQKTCHRLKTSVGNLGGDRARPSVLELERLARSGSLTGAEPLFDKFVAELRDFETELRGFLSESQTSA